MITAVLMALLAASPDTPNFPYGLEPNARWREVDVIDCKSINPAQFGDRHRICISQKAQHEVKIDAFDAKQASFTFFDDRLYLVTVDMVGLDCQGLLAAFTSAVSAIREKFPKGAVQKGDKFGSASCTDYQQEGRASYQVTVGDMRVGVDATSSGGRYVVSITYTYLPTAQKVIEAAKKRPAGREGIDKL